MSLPPDFTIEFVKAVIPSVLAAGAFAFGAEYLKIKIERKIKETRGETQEERINRLSCALREATSTITDIENELNDRHKLVKKLKEDYARYEKLSSIKEEEVEAIVQALRGEITHESSKSLWKSAAINLVFFLAGLAVTVYMT